MEVIVDFGLFEFLGALSLSLVARSIYSRRFLAIPFLILSVALPVTILYLAVPRLVWWLAFVCLATSLVNATVLLGTIKRGEVPPLSLPRPRFLDWRRVTRRVARGR